MSPTQRKHTLKISAIMSTRMLGLFMLFPVFSLYAKDYQASPVLVGIILGIYGLTQASLQIPFGYLSDKYGRKPMLVFGLLLFLVGSIVAALSDSAMGLVIGRALQGMGAISSVLMATLADGVSADNRIKANTMLGVQIGVAFLAALIIAPSIAHYFSLSGLFWFIALLAIFALILTSTLPGKSAKFTHQNTFKTSFRSVLTLPLMRLNSSIYLLHLVLSANFVVLPLILLNQLSLPLVDSWQFYLPVMLGSFLLMLPFVIIVHRYKKTQMVLMISILGLTLLEGLLYFLPNSFYGLMVLMLGFFVFFNVIEASLPSLVASLVSPENKGTAMGVFSTAQFLGVFSGGLLGGFVYGVYGMSSVFLLSAIIGFVWSIFFIASRAKLS